MALLATLDVDDLATEKIKRTKNALDDLVQSARRSAQAIQQATSGGGGGSNQTAAQAQAQAQAITSLMQSVQAAVASINQLNDSVSKMTQKFQGLKPPTEEAASGLDKMRLQAAAVGAALTYLGANMKDVLEEAARLAARVEMLGVVTQITARNAGYTTAQLQAQTEGIKHLGITTQEATNSVLQFVRSNLNLADASKLARVAQDLAVVSGENSSQTFQRLTRAIQMQETMLLHQVGIVTTNEALWNEYAQTIGKTASQLSHAEKQQAFVNKILVEGAKVAGAYEASMDTAGKQLTSMARLTEELSLRIGKVLLPAFSAIVKAVFTMLEWLNKLDPVWLTIGASMATAATVMTLVTAGIVSMAVAFGSLMVVLEALEISLGPVGWIALGLGVAAGAMVAFSSSVKVTTMDLAAQAAAVNEQTRTINNALVAYGALDLMGVQLTKTGEKQTEQQKELRESIDALAKAVPSAREEFDKLTGTYVLNRNEIYRVLAANEELRKTLVKGAELQIQGMELDKQAAEATEKATLAKGTAAREALKAMEAEIARLNKLGGPGTDVAKQVDFYTKALADAQIAVQNYGAGNLEAAKKVAQLTVQIKNAKELVGEMNLDLPERQKQILQGVTHGWDEFEKRAKAAKVSLQKIADFKLTENNEGGFRQMVAGLVSDVEKAETLIAKNKTKFDQQFKTALENIRNTGQATEATLSAVNKGLGEVAEGTDEYRLRVLRAAQAIGMFDKASEKTKKNFDHIAKASEYLKAVHLEEWAEGVSASFDKMALSASEAMNKVSTGLSGDVTKMFRERGEQEYELRRATAEKIDQLDNEIADKRAEQTLEGVDLAIYQENRRVQEIEKALEREIAARERAQKKAEDLFEERVQQAQADVRELAHSIDLQIGLMEKKTAFAIRAQQAEMKITQEVADQQVALLHTMADETRAQVDESKKFRLDEIEDEAQIGRRRLQQSHTLNDQLAKDQRSSLDRQKAASAETVQQFRRDNSVIFQLTRDLSINLANSVTKGFLDILTQARSTKDAFVGIIRSMADTVLNIIQDMISQWIRKAALLATSNGGFNVGTFIKAFTGMAGGRGGAQSVAGLTGGFSTLTMQGGQLGMSGAAGGSGTGAMAGVAGGLLAGTGGYAVGSLLASKFGRDSYFHSGGIGAASGAGAGAAIGSVVPGIGTGVGAGVGAIAGAIGGWMQERKRRKELMTERDQIIQDMGGLDEFKRKAEEAGVALDKFLDTKKSKVYAAELDKIQKAFVALDVKKFIEAQGGMTTIVEKAKAVGIELTDAFKNGTGEAAAMERELEKVAKALQLKEAKDDLAHTVTQMDDLRKRAVLVGYDLKKLYDTKTIEEFAAEQTKLNKLLEDQKVRLEGLGTAASGVEQRIKGLKQFLDKSVKDVLSTLGESAQKQFEDMFKKAQDSGYQGGPLKFLIENMDQFKQSMTEATGVFDKMQQGFNRAGSYVAGVFGGVLRETGDIMAAFNAVSGSLDELAQIAQETGVQASGALKYLLQFRTTIKDNEDVANSLSGINQILRGMSDAGRLTAEMFNNLGADASEQWRILAERGVAADQALMLMQPTLQSLYEAQKNFGFQTDEATQALIDMGIANGVVGDQFQSVNQKMLDMLMLIAEALGATIPEAYRKQQAAATAASSATSGMTEEQQKAAQDALRQQEEAAKAADETKKKTGDLTEKTKDYRDYVSRQEWRKEYDDARGGIVDMGNQFETAKDQVHDFADSAVADLERVTAAASAVSLGHSPGGLKEIPIKTADAMEAFYRMRQSAERDLGSVETRVNAINAAYAGDTRGTSRERPRQRAAADGAGSTTIHVKMSDVNVNISAVDHNGVEKLFREKIRPQLIHDMETNAEQTATRMEAAARRHRR